MALAALAVTGLGFLISNFRIQIPSAGLPGVEMDSAVWSGSRQLHALELREPQGSFVPGAVGRKTTKDKFAYLWLRLENRSDRAVNGVVASQSRNYYTGFLAIGSAGALSVYEHGDTIPASRYPFRYYRAAFPLTLDPGETRVFVLEYHGPRGLVVDPVLMETPDFFAIAIRERTFMAFASGCFVFVVILLIAKGLVLGMPVMYGAAFFVAAVFFFFLRQSRALLMLLDPWIYPEWIFPASIALNLVAALVFAMMLLGKHCRLWHRWSFIVLATMVSGCVILSFFVNPYEIADILNLLAFPVLGLIVILAWRALKAGDHAVILIALAFVPWVVMMVQDILSGLTATKLGSMQEYQQLVGLAGSMVLLAVALELIQSSRGRKSEVPAIQQEHLVAQGTIEDGMAVSLHALEGGVRMLGREFHDPKHVSLTKMILRETRNLQNLLDKAYGWSSHGRSLEGVEDDDPALAGHYAETNMPWLEEPGEDLAPRIGLFCKDHGTAVRLGLIMGAERLRVQEFTNLHRCLDDASIRTIQVLVVDVGSTGDEAFRLCSLVRAERNMLELPILMLLPGVERSHIVAGYAAGVNDFLGYPANPALMAARIQSLVRLRQVFGHNVDLAKIEQEKNAFLYFMTHNINTPLTLLINRIEEMEGRCQEEDRDLLDDLKVSAQEISEIVQNVLISFRLSDGKATVRLGPVDLDGIVRVVASDLTRKAAAKNLSLTIHGSSDGQRASGDAFSIRNVLYNLVDNALKFSNPGSKVEITTSLGPDADGSLIVDVRDYGPGVSKADQARLFGRFQKLSAKPTAGESSTGLGLYVAREMAILNGGSLRYIAAEQGACFSLLLRGWNPPEENQSGQAGPG
jgi:signal transduction histidine kinase